MLKKHYILFLLFVACSVAIADARSGLAQANDADPPDADAVVLTADAEQQPTERVLIYFRVGYRYVNPNIRDNAARLKEIIELINSKYRDGKLLRVSVTAGASPDGNTRANIRLARNRVESLASYIVSNTVVPTALVEKRTLDVNWDGLRNQVEASDIEGREDILAIIDTRDALRRDSEGKLIDNRKQRLMSLRGGVPYNIMKQRFFPDLRSGAVIAIYEKPVVKPDTLPADTLRATVAEPEPAEEMLCDTVCGTITAVYEQPVVAEEPAEPVSAAVLPDYVFIPQLRLKTNAVGLAMLISNIGVEIDLNEHLSVNVPIYYSGVNYFSHKVKFRIFGMQPELRFRPAADSRFFAGVHLGFAYYNFATGGRWRIQDRDGNTPCWGGGINLGYRHPLTDDGRWNVEFSVGAGVYDARYDRFHNVHNGALESTRHKVFVGVDNVAISFSYSFNLKK